MHDEPELGRPFGDGRLALRVTGNAATFPFVAFAQALVDEHEGEIVERVGALGADEVYWDIRFRGGLLTLHGQHYLGVFLCATDEPSEELLRGMVPFVRRYLEESGTFWRSSR